MHAEQTIEYIICNFSAIQCPNSNFWGLQDLATSLKDKIATQIDSIKKTLPAEPSPAPTLPDDQEH